MTTTKRKCERKEFEIYCDGRAYRIIRNYEGLVFLEKFVRKECVGWVWQYVLDTRWDSKAMREAITVEIPTQDQHAINEALLAEIVALTVPAKIV